MKNKKSNQRGSVTLFVLVTMLFLITILILSYMNQTPKVETQKKAMEEIEKQYNKKEIEKIYNEIRVKEETN